MDAVAPFSLGPVLLASGLTIIVNVGLGSNDYSEILSFHKHIGNCECMMAMQDAMVLKENVHFPELY